MLPLNDITSAVKFKLLLYANDSALIVPGNNTKEIQQELSNELESIRECLIDNKLSLYLGKTQSILFASKGNLHKINSIQVQFTGSVLSFTQMRNSMGPKMDH